MKTIVKASLLLLFAGAATQSNALFTTQALAPARLKSHIESSVQSIKNRDAAIKRVQDSLSVFKAALNQPNEVLINFTKNKTFNIEESLAYYDEDNGWIAYTPAEVTDMFNYLSAKYVELSVATRNLKD